jgi:hypothetical protein
MDETYTEKTFILGIRAGRGVQSEVGLAAINDKRICHLSIGAAGILCQLKPLLLQNYT